jgi:hypothetical protein
MKIMPYYKILTYFNTGYSYKFHFLTICPNFATKSIGNGQSVPSTCSPTLGYGIPSSPDSRLLHWPMSPAAPRSKGSESSPRAPVKSHCLGNEGARWPSVTPISREKVSFNQEQTHGLNLLKRCFNGLKGVYQLFQDVGIIYIAINVDDSSLWTGE